MKFTKMNMFVCSVLASAPPTFRDVGFGYPHHRTSPTPTTIIAFPHQCEGAVGMVPSSENEETYREQETHLFVVSTPCTSRLQHCQGYSMLSVQLDKHMSSIPIANIFTLKPCRVFSPHNNLTTTAPSLRPHYTIYSDWLYTRLLKNDIQFLNFTQRHSLQLPPLLQKWIHPAFSRHR